MRRVAGILLGLLVLFGCGPRYLRRDIAKRTWLELRTEHLILTTDLPRARAEERLRELEELWWGLSDVYEKLVPIRPAPPRPIPVIHFARCDDFEQVIWSKNVAGFVNRSYDFEEVRTVVTCEQSAVRRVVLVHELAHVFNARYLGAAPVWVNEGLAKYFETMAVDDGRGKIILGRISPLAWHAWGRPMNMPGLGELLDMRPDRFYGRGRYRDGHFAAWCLVHLLNNSSERYRARFVAFLTNIANGVPRSRSWQAAFDDIDHAEIEGQYRSYRLRGELRYYLVDPQSHPAAAADVRRLRAGEIHALWVQLQMGRMEVGHEPDVGLLRSQLDLATRDDPGWHDLLLFRAAVVHYFEDQRKQPVLLSSAIDGLRQLVAVRPDDRRARLALVEMRLAQIVPEDHTGLDGRPVPGLEALEPDVMQLSRLSPSPRSLALVATYFALRQQPETGYGFAQRAIDEDRGCHRCYEARALMNFHLGRPHKAVADQERALEILSEEEPPPAMLARLKRYRAAAAREPIR